MRLLTSLHSTPGRQSLVERVAALSRERFAERASEYDAASRFPRENYDDLRDAGLLAMAVPKKYGGLGVDPLTYALCVLEMAKGCSATALTFNMHSTVLTLIDMMATEDQKRRYFAEVVEEGKLFASITSEPESSFRDKYVMRTAFIPIEGGYQVKGVKHFCSIGDSADYFFLSGMLEGHTTSKEGILSAVMPRGTPGVQVESEWNATGMRGTASHTIRYDSPVSQDDVVGAPGALLSVDLSGFALGYAATYLGIAEAAFDFIVEYSKGRSSAVGSRPLDEDMLTLKTIGEMGTSIRAARLMMYDAALAKSEGEGDATMLAVNQAKYLCAEVGADVTERAMRMAGGRGFLKSMPLERWHRDSLAGPVMPPVNERCMETAGRLLCGLRAATLEFK
ncbi:MAG: acyl-CoA/acyl-ACP dehydrogenase [Chloroflexi bacterium]|nr:acyl-CoA/acyl-ACP dehydrogenase [Chloroflexota bacterium]